MPAAEPKPAVQVVRPARADHGTTPRLPDWARPKTDQPGGAVEAGGPHRYTIQRSHLVLAAMGAVLIALGSYLAGARMARRSADAYWQAKLEETTTKMVQAVSTNPADPAGGAAPAAGAESRTPGLNYLRLCTVPAGMGQEIAAYLMQNKVRPALVPVRGGQEVVMYAADRGFRAEEINSPAHNQYQTRLIALGATWGKSHGSRNPFAAPSFEKYDPARTVR